MKKYNILLLSGLVLLSTSCKKYLDVNKNPNSVTQEIATPELILPAAMSTTGSLSVTYSNYGSALGGGYANAGGFSGFAAGFMSYNFSTGDYAGLWNSGFDNMEDYQFILSKTAPTGDYRYFNAIARTMKAFAYLRLVDVYGNVPYSQAFKGADNITPAYDKAEDIYKACIADLNTAIASFNLVVPGTSPVMPGGRDIYGQYNAAGTFTNLSSDMRNWVRFANTIKLRALLRIQKVTSLSSTYTTEMASLAADPLGFVTFDLVSQPGYFNQSGKSNPTFASWGVSNTGALLATSSIPTPFAVGFYDGKKIADQGRGLVMYRNLQTYNQLGNQSNATAVPAAGIFYSGSAPLSAATGLGFAKGYTQAQPIMLAAEAYFLVAEANTLGFFGGAGAAKANFEKGILASFTYLDKTEAGVVAGNRAPATEFATYKTGNATNPLVIYDLATTPAQQLEAIITQKYIALNMITANESWSDYKRTTYPRTIPGGQAYQDMASIQSLSTRADKLPGRILYPTSEFSTNPNNVPTNINPYTSLIFWDIAATGGTR